MPTWNELLAAFQAQPDATRGAWLEKTRDDAFAAVSATRGDRNVVLYASAFLQKGAVVPQTNLSIMHEDLNGFMGVIHGMEWDKGLTLLLHTPGGSPNAAETIVAYLRSKFDSIEVIVPTLAMSAGTMIALASDLVVMGRQSQLGPIDTQFGGTGARVVSARAIVEQFKRAQSEILADPANAHVWAPITQSLGPALLQDAQHALDYSEEMVARWLKTWMFSDETKRKAASHGKKVAKHFNDATTHKSHGRRIDYAEVESLGVKVEKLETNQDLQEAVLTAYHVMTLMFEHTMMAKMIIGSNGQSWAKNFKPPAPPGP